MSDAAVLCVPSGGHRNHSVAASKPPQHNWPKSVVEQRHAKRVRMPSSVLSELYPALPTPCFRELHSGPVKVADERERKFQFGPSLFTPKHPFMWTVFFDTFFVYKFMHY
uniref:Uncharacterized protein n=1 Tax=Globodera rostochiensis TaxID=31243 RepID=A0A914I7I9_GLORO